MRVLFVVKEYLPKPTPPGICIMNVQKALLDKDVQSDVLMVSDREGLYCTNETGNVYSIRSEICFETGNEGLVRYIKTRLPMLITWPVASMKRVDDYRRVITELNNQLHYDAIIGTMFPPDVCVACSVFDHFFYYELDSLINNPVYKEGVKKLLNHRLKRLEKWLFKRAEMIIHLKNNQQFYSSKKYNQFFRKFVYTDIPELVEQPYTDYGYDHDRITELADLELMKNQTVMVYSGLLSKEYRSPSRLIEMVKGIGNNMEVKCLFFSRGDCEDELREAEKETAGIIKRMGYVSQEELAKYINRADFLLDIGNHLSGEDYSLPSKVICYMATGKPIIHMNGTNDSAISYLEKYGLAINVSEEKTTDEMIQDVLKFMTDNKGKRIPFSEVVHKFPQNTPEYTADLIIDHIKERNIK